MPACLNIQYVCDSQRGETVLTPAYPSAFSSVFGNGIPWSEVHIQLLRSGHKLDFLKLGKDGVSGVSFTGALKPHLPTAAFIIITQIP